MPLAILLSLPLVAQKRHSVGMPEVDSGTAITISFQGTVTDAATGLPVAFANITTDKGTHLYTSRFGTFAFSAVSKVGDVDVTAGRTGYDSSTVRVSGAGTHELNFRLQSRHAAILRKIDGTIVTLDDDSVKFGYIVPFIAYQTATGNSFCMTDGTQAKIPVAQMTRITSLGTSVPGSCCQNPAQRVLLELRDDSIHDATFIDSCYGYSVDLIARDHATGDVVFVPFAEVSEIVFP